MRWLVGVGQDLRAAVRLYAAAPIVAAVAVLSLGLGIGSTTAIFSLINSVYLRPLPVDEPSELVYIQGPTRSGRAGHEVAERLRAAPGVFESTAAYAETQFDISPDNEAQWVDGLWVSGSFFATMAVRPFAGRLLSDTDDVEGGGADGLAAVISHALWQRRFDSAPDTIGRRVEVNHAPFTIVGIAPAGFFGPNVGRSFDVVVPLATASDVLAEGMPRPGEEVIARLHANQTLIAANTAMQAVLTASGENAARIAAQVRARPAATGQSPVRAEYLQPLVVLIVLGLLVLLVACANVANLMLAWATVRRHDRSVRLALGASRWRIVRQCLVESFLLAGVSTMFGGIVAFWATRLLLRQLATRDALTAGDIGYGSARLVLDLSLDWRVLVFTTGVAIATAVLFGIAPALRSLRAAPADALKEPNTLGAQAGAVALSRFGVVRIGVAGWILIAQVALSLMLAVSAGLLVRSFTVLSNVDLGLDASRAMIVNLRRNQAEGEAPIAAEQILETVRALPGVTAAAVSLGTPPISSGAHEMLAVANADPPADPNGTANLVSPEWFAALGMRSTSGRLLAAEDRRGAPRVAVVNEAFVRTFLGGSEPIGRTISSFEAPIEIVGVVRDVVSGWLRDPPAPAVYLPLAQAEGRLQGLFDIISVEQGLMLTVRSATDQPRTLARGVVEAIQRVDPGATLTIRYMNDRIEALTTRERVLAMLSGFFGGLALLLAALGLYGLVAYAVARQRREIAVRIALGARPQVVVRSVVARMVGLLGAGVLVGAVLTAWSGQFIATFLYGVDPHEVSILVGAALILTVGGAFVAWLPARHTARIDPASVLRYE